jgi:hypothetical protein
MIFLNNFFKQDLDSIMNNVNVNDNYFLQHYIVLQNGDI